MQVAHGEPYVDNPGCEIRLGISPERNPQPGGTGLADGGRLLSQEPGQVADRDRRALVAVQLGRVAIAPFTYPHFPSGVQAQVGVFGEGARLARVGCHRNGFRHALQGRGGNG